MAIETWLPAVLVGVPGLVAGIVAVVKVRSETRKLDAGTTAELIAGAGDFVASFRDDVSDLRTRLRAVEKRERSRDRMLRVHHDWDRGLVADARRAGIPVSDPPPLWPDEED